MSCKVSALGWLMAAVLMVPAAAGAADITYYMNDAVGSGGVEGWITTDGTLGTLSVGDIVSWELDVTSNNFTWPVDVRNSQVYVVGSDLTATSTELFFNFSGADSGYLWFHDAPLQWEPAPFACFVSASANQCYTSGGISVSSIGPLPGYANPTVPVTGTVAIAGPTPEPATWAMMLVGFGLAGGAMRWRRSASRDASAG